MSDFGLAKRIDQAEGGLTGAGILGTPGYLAPEQVAGSPVTARTDVYGLGATLYHALTGHAPVEADAPHELALLVLNAEPRHVRAHRPGVPLELEAIVHKCLEKEPAGRYASAAELADDLERFAAGEPVSARPLTRARRAWRAVARSRRRLARLAAVAAALVAVFALGAGVGDRPRSRQEPVHRIQEELKAGRSVTLVGATGEPGWHRWVHGASGFAPAADRDDACMFQSFDLTTLELCPDPMTDRYRVRAELCQADVKDRTPDGELPKGGGYRVGLYFGRQSAAGNDGWRAECCLAVLFTEVPNAPAARVTFGRLMVTESPAQRPTVSRAGSASTPFTQADTLPGPWRTVEVEVTPEGVKAWVEHPGGARVAFVDLPAERVDRLYRTRNDGLDRWFPNHGVTTPAWNPRSGLGVWSQGSSLAMRNVTVTPLK